MYDLFAGKYKKRFEWIRSDLFKVELKKLLISDGREIIKILSVAKEWNPDEDRQLDALFELINGTHKKEKILVFTQFADTAGYLCEQLKKRGVQSIACVTGDCDNPTEYAHRFSPVSNEKPAIKSAEKQLLKELKSELKHYKDNCSNYDVTGKELSGGAEDSNEGVK